MSLPPTQKDISTHPAKGSVVSPVDKEAKEADVDRKIRLYGILTALRSGKLPSNAQLNNVLNHILSTLSTASSSSSHSTSTSASKAHAQAIPEGTPATQYTTTNTTAKYANLSANTQPSSTHPAFAATRPATNADPTATTNAKGNAKGNTPRLSPPSQKLLSDLSQIIQSTQLIIQEKNADELLQDFVWGLRGVDGDGLKGALLEAGEGDIPVGREKVQEDAQVATKHLRTLLTLLLSNAELRKLLTDFSLIGRDILARAASSAARTIAPHPDALARVDNPVPAHEGEGAFVVGSGVGGDRRPLREGEEPVLEARIPGTDVRVRQEPGEEFGYGAQVVDPQSQAQGQGNGERGRKVRDIKNDAVGVAGEAVGKGVGEAKGHVDDVANADEEDRDEVVEAKKGGVMGKMRQMRDTVRDNFSSTSDKIPQEHKDLAQEKIERGKKLFSEEYFPRERREQFVWRGKKVILELQKHDNYQESIRWLIAYLKEYLEHGRSVAGAGRGAGMRGVESANLTTSLTQLRTLLERFANNNSLNTVFDAVDALVDDARRDDALRVWWESVGVWCEKILLEPGYILEPQSTTHAHKLADLGREFYEGKYRGHFEGFFDAVAGWVAGVGEDPVNKQFAGDWARLTRDLLFDSEGSLKFKPELWNDVRKVILPAVIDQIGYIPIPRIEYTDESLDLVVENLTLQGRNLLPNIVSLEANNFIRFSAYSAVSTNDERGMPVDAHGNPVEEMLNRHKVSLHLEQMQADMRDVAFYYRKKTGIPKMKDSGIADVVVGGQGLSVLIELISSPPQDHTSVFKIHDIQVKLDTLKFSIRDSNHDFLYKTLRPLATGLIKKQVKNAVRDAVRTGLEYLDGQLIFARATNKNTSTSQKPDDAISTATGGALSTGSSASSPSPSSPTKSSQFKIVADKRNSILADQGNPAGWVNRVEERRGMVGSVGGKAVVGGDEGKGWKSDA